jgi:hypothetical protein
MPRGRRKAQAENGSDQRARKQLLSVNGFSFRTYFVIYSHKSVGDCRRVGSLDVSPYDLDKNNNQTSRWGRVTIGRDFILNRVCRNGSQSETVGAESYMQAQCEHKLHLKSHSAVFSTIATTRLQALTQKFRSNGMKPKQSARRVAFARTEASHSLGRHVADIIRNCKECPFWRVAP